MVANRIVMPVLLCSLAIVLTSCGRADRPPLGRVSGKVTLDGQPAKGLIIMFSPEDGRPAAATIDDKGDYALEYAYRVPGAKVGKCRVSFEWPTAQPGVPIDSKFGTKSELIADVQPKSNTFNFDITSDKSRKPVNPVD